MIKVTLNDLLFERQLCIIGDLKIDTPLLEKPCASSYSDLIEAFGVECIISAPTREESLSGKIVRSCIDHINIRANNPSLNVAVIPNKLAGHHFVACQCVSLTSCCHNSSVPVFLSVTLRYLTAVSPLMIGIPS